MKAIVALLLGLALALAPALAPAPAAAQPAQKDLVIGLYAPSAPFSGPAQRLEFVRALANHVAAQTGRKVTGRVFASGGQLSAAIKSGDVQFAVVDAPYAAAIGLPYDVLASAVRGGSAVVSWQLVAAGGIRSLNDLRGKTVAVPMVGAKASAFVSNALLGGEVEAGFFGKIVEAPDALSAATMVGAGRAQAALVPSGFELPGGTRAVLTVASVGWPMFAAAPAVDRATSDRVGAAVRTFSASGPFTGFASADAGRYRSIELSRPSKKGPMAVPPPARLNVRDLLEGRTYTPQLTDVLALVSAEQ